MKHRFSIPALSVCFGAVGFLLRLLQNRTGFEPDTGLPIPGSVPAILLPILLMAAAGILYLAVRRVLPKEMPELPFPDSLTCPTGQGCSPLWLADVSWRFPAYWKL